MPNPQRLMLGSNSSLIGFETQGGGSLPVWDRYLTLEGRRAYHIGNICNTCAFFFERLDGANRSISPSDLADQFSAGAPPLDREWLELVGQILPLGEYQTSFENVRPYLVGPGSPDDYFINDQISLWGIDGFWGLPHHPRTEYYRGRSVVLSGKARLFEFIVPMFPHTWLKPDVVMSYRSRPSCDPPPTALAVSVLDVKEPATWEGEPEVTAHWCLAHYLLDGHHKVFAASQENRKVGLLSYLALKQGVSTADQAKQALNELLAEKVLSQE